WPQWRINIKETPILQAFVRKCVVILCRLPLLLNLCLLLEGPSRKTWLQDRMLLMAGTRSIG
ncbi:hypothetical protein BGX24_005861, partial [Mortierella sp. AD032]